MLLGGAGSIYPSQPGKLYAWGSAKGNHLPGLKGDNQRHQCFPEQIFKKTKISIYYFVITGGKQQQQNQSIEGCTQP